MRYLRILLLCIFMTFGFCASAQVKADTSNYKVPLSKITAEYNGTIIVGSDLVKEKMLVTGYYLDGTSKVITNFTHDFTKTYTTGIVTVRVTADGISTSTTIPVVAKEMVSLAVTKMPTKIQYGWQDPIILDLSGIEATITYNDGSTIVLDSSSLRYKVATNPYSMGNAYYGDYTVYVYPKYGNTLLSDMFNVKVSEKVIVAISATSPTYPTKVSADLNKTGIVVTGVYDTGKTFTIKDDYVIEWVAQEKAGNYEATIRYKEFECKVPVIVEEAKLTYITATFNGGSVLPHAALNKEDFTVVGYMDDGSSIQLTDFTFSKSKLNTVGKHKLTIRSGKFKTIVSVKCAELVVTSIDIEEMPKKTVFLSKEDFTYEGMQIRVTYSNSTSEIISKGFRVTGFDNMSYGKQTIYVTYGTMRTSYEITRKETLVKELKLITSDNTTYYVGEKITLKNLYGYLIYEDGSVTPLAYNDFKCSTPSSAKAGNIPVRVTYEQKLHDGTIHKVSTEVVVSVVKKSISGIYIAKMPKKQEYNIGEKFESKGLVVKARYSEGGSFSVTDQCILSGFSSDKTGKVTVTAKYDTYTADFDVYVKQPTAIRIELVVPAGVELDEITRPTDAGASLVKYYDDGSFEEVDDYSVVALYNEDGAKILRIVSGNLTTDYVLQTAEEMNSDRIENGNFEETPMENTKPINGNHIVISIPLLIEVCVQPSDGSVDCLYTIENKAPISVKVDLVSMLTEDMPVSNKGMSVLAHNIWVSPKANGSPIELAVVSSSNTYADILTWQSYSEEKEAYCGTYYPVYKLTSMP